MQQVISINVYIIVLIAIYYFKWNLNFVLEKFWKLRLGNLTLNQHIPEENVQFNLHDHDTSGFCCEYRM